MRCDSTKFITLPATLELPKSLKVKASHLLVDTSPLRFFTLHLSTEDLYISDAMKRG